MAVIIRDEFVDTNGVLLTAHTIAPINTPGALWYGEAIPGLPTMQIQSSAASPGGINGLRSNYLNALVSDCVLSVDTTTGITDGVDSIYVVFRRVDGSNLWYANLDKGFGFRLFEVTSGVTTLRASESGKYVADSPYSISVFLSGSSIVCVLSGTRSSSLSYTSSSQLAATKYGILSYQTSLITKSITFDNFRIEAGNAVPAIQHYYTMMRGGR
jgi:hypothetical protein